MRCDGAVLLAAFEPFAGRKRNRALAVAERVARKAGTPLVMLPVDFRRLRGVLARLHRRACRTGARGLLLLGEDRGSRELKIERVGLNLLDAAIADNAGRRPRDQEVEDGAPLAYRSTAPCRAWVGSARRAGVAARLSTSAGTFACNAALYWALHFATSTAPAEDTRPYQIGFLHVPAARGAPPLAAMADAIETLVTGWRDRLRADGPGGDAGGTLRDVDETPEDH